MKINRKTAFAAAVAALGTLALSAGPAFAATGTGSGVGHITTPAPVRDILITVPKGEHSTITVPSTAKTDSVSIEFLGPQADAKAAHSGGIGGTWYLPANATTATLTAGRWEIWINPKLPAMPKSLPSNPYGPGL